MARAVCEKTFDSYKEFYINTLPGTELGNALNGFVFRGQAREEYKLLPSALRSDNNFRNMVNAFLPKYGRQNLNFDLEYDQIIGECILLREFCERANQQGLQIPHLSYFLNVGKDYGVFSKHFERIIDANTLWPPEDIWPLISLAQHYGVPTRFLDWTFERNIAAYFALKDIFIKDYGSKIKNIIVWAIDTNYLSSPDSNLRFIVPTYYDNPNIKSQQGLFSCLLCPSSMLISNKEQQGSVKISVDDIYTNCKIETVAIFLYKFKISTKNIAEDYNFLMNMGASANRLFPGYGGSYKAMEDYMNFHNFINRLDKE